MEGDEAFLYQAVEYQIDGAPLDTCQLCNLRHEKPLLIGKAGEVDLNLVLLQAELF